MLCALLLQASAYLNPEPATNPTGLPSADYRERLTVVLETGEVELDQLETLRPTEPDQEAVLLQWMGTGNAEQLKLACLLASGASAESGLAQAAIRAGCELRRDDLAMAALLAPQRPSAGDLPGLAYLALTRDRSLSIRACAVARLLDADCESVWPVARSIFRTGSPVDEAAPWADWARSGRYELPKRTLLLSVQDWLKRHAQAACDYEPNAAWSVQVEQLERLEPAAEQARADAKLLASESERAAFDRSFIRLLEAAQAGDRRALRAASLLQPHGRDRLRRWLGGTVAQSATARAVIERIPR